MTDIRDPYIIIEKDGYWYSFWNGREVSACFRGPFRTAGAAYQTAVNYKYQPVPKLPVVVRPFVVFGLECLGYLPFEATP